MGNIRRAVKLEHDGLPIGGPRDDLLEVLERPIRVSVAGGRNEQGVMMFGIVSRAKLQRAIVSLRLFAAPRELVTQFDQPVHSFWSKSVPAIGEADWLRHFRLGLAERAIHQK